MTAMHMPRVPKPDVCQPTGSAELAMLDVYMPMMKSSAIISAGRLGLFEALAAGPLTAAQLAEKIQSSLKGTAALADFLIALGYLEKQDQRLANTASTQRWFTSVGQVDYTPGLLWTHEAWPMMGGLAEAVRSGHPEKTLWDAMIEQSHLGELFSSYMAAFASDLGPDLLKHVPVSPKQHRLLDLGGSHGLHAIRFCRRYPQLSAVIVDLPSALTETGTTIEKEQLADRIRLSPGDLQAQDWGGEHDLVFYLSVAHNHTAEENRQVIRRIGETLSPGGLLVIHEYLAETPLDALDAAFRLTLLVETGTQTYRYDEYCNWLTTAGFDSIVRIDLDPREKGSLILARR
ncbi:MAG: O-methyltransferase, family 2 [Proteobacteria bacterium]|nr:O-methyltransferase, family 2 [Pseudomonadota bacterium]